LMTVQRNNIDLLLREVANGMNEWNELMVL
jgi:hypothetical protein